MPTRSDEVALDRAWSNVFTDFPANHAVTLVYNPAFAGTVFPTHRITPHGERIRLPMPAMQARSGVWQLPSYRKIPAEQIRADLDRLHRDMDRKLFGVRFHRLSPEKRTRFIGLIENPETNVHVHLLWHVAEDRAEEFGEIIEPLWRKAAPHGSAEIKRPYDRGWGSYCTKQRPALKAPELFVATRT